MNIIPVRASATYDVCVGSGLLDKVGESAAAVIKGRSALIVSDSNVWPLYGRRVTDSLTGAGFRTEQYVFPAGECSKTPETLLEVLTELARKELTRSDCVVALGGGVTGDLAGLAAALYLRGVPCIQLPTSLLAMVDSSVGGKTAVDLPEGKNLMGTFTQPRLVLCDPEVLATLPAAVRAEGWAEIIKYGMLGSEPLLEALSNGPDSVDIESIITHCVEMKRDVVAEDERDTGMRQILNFGHTIGHAIERCADFEIYHGEAVAIGMAVMTRACVRRGSCQKECLTVLDQLLDAYGLPKVSPVPAEDILRAARADKKRRGEKITLIQPLKPGLCILNRTDYGELEAILNAGMEP